MAAEPQARIDVCRALTTTLAGLNLRLRGLVMHWRFNYVFEEIKNALVDIMNKGVDDGWLKFDYSPKTRHIAGGYVYTQSLLSRDDVIFSAFAGLRIDHKYQIYVEKDHVSHLDIAAVLNAAVPEVLAPYTPTGNHHVDRRQVAARIVKAVRFLDSYTVPADVQRMHDRDVEARKLMKNLFDQQFMGGPAQA